MLDRMALESRPPEYLKNLVRAMTLGLASWAGGPVAGLAAAMDAALGGRPSRLIRQRLDQFLEALRTEFVRLLEPEQARQYVESQDFAHLVLLAVEAGAKERQREKIRAYARLVARAGTPKWGNRVDRVEEALHSLAEMTEAEVTIVKAIMEWSRAVERAAGPTSAEDQRVAGALSEDADNLTPDLIAGLLEPYLPGFPKDRIRPYLARLQRLGLILEVPGASWERMSGGYAMMPLFDELLELLSVEKDGPQ
jgi:hypothetical protein